MNILGGVVSADSGRISVDDREVHLRSPRDATRQGIAFVHQELTMFPTMTVAENIFIGRHAQLERLIDFAKMNRDRPCCSDASAATSHHRPLSRL